MAAAALKDDKDYETATTAMMVEESSSSSSTTTITTVDQNGTSTMTTFVAKFGKERIILSNLPPHTTILTIKSLLQEQTRILPKRQKLIGLTTIPSAPSKKVTDDVMVSQIKFKPSKKDPLAMEFILMGTPEENIFVDPSERGDDLPDVVDDLDWDFNAGSEQWVRHVAKEENLRKFTDSTMIHIMNEPRDGGPTPNPKPLMVLDLDHTLLDFFFFFLRQASTYVVGDSSAQALKRPYMDEFLTAAYVNYDLVVWSQTSWRWLETKLTELGMLTHPGYKFCFVLDKTSMFAITSTRVRDGVSHQHYVKPLQIIWTKFPRWNSHNTVHLDDLSRNFALNLSSGLKVSGYYRKKSKGTKRDNELQGLMVYMDMLAKDIKNFDSVNFADWMDVVSGKKQLLTKEEDNNGDDGANDGGDSSKTNSGGVNGAASGKKGT